ncbi:MAG: type I restriction enzyme HsdR N-terminal domain-containing protein [Tannerellaceae bacterium]|jgi:hypothetical protein|nr:type I restriction enzyme HsdR N-terminal domain-containing protein [Tannerellaceae bacterium]
MDSPDATGQQILNLPPADLRLSQAGGRPKVFDPLRGRYVALTPEEWVRQRFVSYLLADKGYPRNLVVNEVSISLNGTAKRCDTVVYSRSLAPLMIIEYKAPTVELSPAVFRQLARYNLSLRVGYLTVSNGLQHFCCRMDYSTMEYAFLPKLPDYATITAK